MDVTIREGLHKNRRLTILIYCLIKFYPLKSYFILPDNAGEIVFDKIFIEEMISVKERAFWRISFLIMGVPH